MKKPTALCYTPTSCRLGTLSIYGKSNSQPTIDNVPVGSNIEKTANEIGFGRKHLRDIVVGEKYEGLVKNIVE
jgi:hypothetical protein